MQSDFIEEEFEDIIIDQIKALGLQASGKNVYVDCLEGNAMDLDNIGEAIFTKQYPCILVGITGIPTVVKQNDRVYIPEFRLTVAICITYRSRNMGKLSDIRTIRRAVRRSICGNTPYKVGNQSVNMQWISDDYVANINNLVIYEQEYSGRYIESGKTGA